ARSWIGQQQVLRLIPQLFVVKCGKLVGAAAAAAFGPQPLRVTRESLVQPDVTPPPRGHRVAEPLVCQFMGDEPFAGPRAVAVIGPEDRNSLGFKRYLQRVVRDDEGVAV